MSLQLGISLCQTNNCKIIKLSETTGAYDSVTNPTGWDSTAASNPGIWVDEENYVTQTEIEFTLPDDTIVTFDEDYVDGTSVFPNTDSTIEKSYTKYDFGGTSSDPFVDGIYSIRYWVEYYYLNVLTSSEVTQSFLLTCQTRCCIDKLFNIAAQTMDCDSCKKDKLNKALEAESYLKSAEYAAECGKLKLAKQLLAKAQWICNNQNCNNC
jgi:hypothetical protein